MIPEINISSSLYLQRTDVDTENYTYDDYDTGNMTCDFVKMSFQAVFQCVLYTLILLLGVAGNGLMITILLRRWRLLRITEIYLLHLALADLMLLLTFPFDLIETVNGWIFGEFLCKMTSLMKCLNVLCGSFLLGCIAFDRYLAIVRAIPSMQSRRPKRVHQTCIVLWLICLCLSVPNIVFSSVETTNEGTSCYFHYHGIHANNWALTSRALDHLCFFLPLAVMSYCYTAVVVTLCKSQKSQAKQGAVRLALLVTLVFCFCWLPYNITLLISTMVNLEVISFKTCRFTFHLQQAQTVTSSLGFSHCCLNPFLYAFVGVRFRNELLRLLCRLGCSQICMPFIRTEGHSRPSISDGVTTTSTVFH